MAFAVAALLLALVYSVFADDRNRGGIDCNGNGIPDDQDIADGTSEDCDGNGVPDECDTEPTFTAEVIATSFFGPRSVHVADLDGDGRPDVLVGSLHDDMVAWSRNLESGGFAPPTVIDGAADAVRSVFAADLDSDGDHDVLSASGLGGRVDLYENLDGLGNFGPPQLVVEVDYVWAVHAADLDGDADNDIVFAATFVDRVEWLRNDGGGEFVPGQVISIDADGPSEGEGGAVVDPHAVIVADVDGDGDGDVVTASAGDGQIAWFANDGTGTFGERHSASFAADDAEAVAAADLDGDGDLDLLSASPGKIAWYPNFDGAGAFGTERILSATAGGASSVIALDLDGDGDLDVVSAAPDDHTIAWYENLDGAGDFGAEQVVTANATQVVALAGGDLDADADSDFVAVLHGIPGSNCCEVHGSWGCNDPECQDNICWIDPFCCDAVWDQICADEALADPVCIEGCNGGGGRVIWLRNESDDCNGNATPDACEPDCNDNGLADVCEVDCNGNGLADECDVAGGASEDCDGNGVPDECQPDCNDNSVADVCDIAEETSEDCTGDGVPDECQPDCNSNSVADVCEIAGGKSEDCTGNGVPDECEPDCNANSTADSCDIDLGASEDCNGDGVPDECQPDCDANGVADSCDTQLRFTPLPIAEEVSGVYSMVAADVDDDGDTDLVAARSGADKIVWLRNLDGAGTFGPPETIALGVDSPRAVRAADLDGDGDLDVLSASSWDDTVAWYENLGGGGFGAQRVLSNQVDGAAAVDVADLDGDGDRDVAASSLNYEQIVWFENLDGEGNFGPKLTVGTVSASDVRIADVDGDGDRDLAFADPLGWHENVDGQGSFTSEHLVTGGTGFEVVVPADIDGDGDVDFLAEDDSSTIAWFANTDGAGTFTGPRTVSTAAANVYSLFVADVDGDGDSDVLSGSVHDDKVAWYPNLDGGGTFGPQRILEIVTYQATAVLAVDVNGDGTIDPISAAFMGGALTWYRNESGDCDASGVPDVCEPDCDDDGITDACDLDGADGDGDGYCDDADCAPLDGDAWLPPGQARDLRLWRQAKGVAMSWSAPEDPGASEPLYDLLRSDSATTFAAATCVETGDTDTNASDSSTVPSGGLHHYLVRVENACGSAMGAGSSGVPREGPPCD